MYIGLEALKYFFETMKFFQDENGTLMLDPSVLIYCSADIDAICAAEIFKKMFFLKHVIWSLTPIRFSNDFTKCVEKPSPLAKSLRAIILLNVGGDINIPEFFDLKNHLELSVIVIDSLNPINLRNLYEDTKNVFLLLNENSADDQALLEKALSKERKENRMIPDDVDDYGYPIRNGVAFGSYNQRGIRPPKREKYGPSIALQTYILSSKNLLKDNDMLWLAIIGQTSLFISRKIDFEEYEETIKFIDAEVSELNDISTIERVHRFHAVPSHPDD
ncbi:hypothetical protein Glove_346g174 [Diversispora epigaea]|uniref:Uncharacterized protein n=1 Tax=Diversispora epigaea TaxID=1348612 RepID=A0A397HFH0_9GLOM|nr:hypothetical protein Glove_346g174 [Diversispora epigaea]